MSKEVSFKDTTSDERKAIFADEYAKMDDSQLFEVFKYLEPSAKLSAERLDVIGRIISGRWDAMSEEERKTSPLNNLSIVAGETNKIDLNNATNTKILIQWIKDNAHTREVYGKFDSQKVANRIWTPEQIKANHVYTIVKASKYTISAYKRKEVKN